MKGVPVKIVRGNAHSLPVENESVDLIITSPPYHGLRGYEDKQKQYKGQVGAEPTQQEFLEALWSSAAECWRVLKPGGSLFFNLGDRYDKKHPTANGVIGGEVPTKSLTGLPWRFAVPMFVDTTTGGGSWILRAEIIWHRTNAMPESASDRVMRRHEQWFHFTKSERYYSAADTLREVRPDGSLGSLPGSVWDVPSEPIRGIPEGLPRHTATFPSEFVRRLVLGWSPSGICVKCGEPRRPVMKREFTGEANVAEGERQKQRSGVRAGGATTTTLGRTDKIVRRFDGEKCGCKTPTADTIPSVVLDPFGGSGTTAAVASALGRQGISVDLSYDYCKLARWRAKDKSLQQRILDRSVEVDGVRTAFGYKHFQPS